LTLPRRKKTFLSKAASDSKFMEVHPPSATTETLESKSFKSQEELKPHKSKERHEPKP
jgi:hypothetical protein